MTIDKTKIKSEVDSTLAKGAGLLMVIRAEDVRGLLEEIERLEREQKNDLVAYKAAIERQGKLRIERDQLKAENKALRSARLWWVAPPGLGIIRCVTDERYRKFSPSIRARYEPVVVQDYPELRKDAERYRWLCDGHGYFMEEAGLCGHSNEKQRADQEIDEAMAKEAEL